MITFHGPILENAYEYAYQNILFWQTLEPSIDPPSLQAVRRFDQGLAGVG